MTRPGGGELERVAHDPVDTAAGEHRGLLHDLLLGTLEAAAADRRILALVVLAHDDEVDLAGRAVSQRRADAGHQPDRTDAGVLLERAADLDEQAPERDMVRHLGRPADRAQEDGLVALDLVKPVLGHHVAVLEVVVAAPGQLVPLELEPELTARRVEHAHALRHHLLADAVTGDHRDLVLGHKRLLKCPLQVGAGLCGALA